MRKMKKVIIALGIILAIICLAFGIKSVFAGGTDEVCIYRCNVCMSKYDSNDKNSRNFYYYSKNDNETTCPHCGATGDDFVRTQTQAIVSKYWGYREGRDYKWRKTFETTYKCEKGHIYSPTGSNYDRYKWRLGGDEARQTGYIKCPYAGCGADGVPIEKQNIVHIRGLESSAIFDNVYCVAHGQNMDTVIQAKGGLFDAQYKVEINGNNANFYEYKKVDGEYKYTLIGTSSNEINNKIAAILAAPSIEKGFSNNYDANEQYLVKNMVNEIWDGTWKDGTLGKYEDAQILIYNYWNEWIDTSGASKYGFTGDASNDRASVDYIIEKRNLDKKLEEVTGEYSATIYFLRWNKNYNYIEGRTYAYDISNKDSNSLVFYPASSVAPGSDDYDGKQNGGSDYNLQEMIMVDLPVYVTKVWKDNENSAGTRPESITVELLADGVSTGRTLVLNDANNWSAKFDELDRKDSKGNLITYTVKEATVPGYTSTIEGDQYAGYTITNTIIPAKTEVNVVKEWKDSDNKEGLRPSSITVTLYANGVSTEKTLTLDESNSWTGKFEDLEKYSSKGEDIVYTIEETTVPNYKKAEYNYTKNEDGKVITCKITNTLNETEVKVVKVWDDNNNAEGYRPTSITVTLYANNVSTGKTITLDESNGWAGSFKNLEDAENIIYTVVESVVPNYKEPEYTKAQQGSITTWTIKNTCDISYTGYIEITGKVWMDGRAGKGNDINGKLDSGESGLKGIKVTLKDKDGNIFDNTSMAYTDGNGNYIIKVNYDNSQNVYKLYEDAATVQEKLKTAYVEFQYNGMKYTTVANAATGENTSKAIEKEDIRNAFDKALTTVTPTTNPELSQNSPMIANTQNVISFETYEDKGTRNQNVVLKACDGNGNYIQTNPRNQANDVLTGVCDLTNHPDNCPGELHELRTHEVQVIVIKNVNLGLFEREQPDVAIFSDLTTVKVTNATQECTFEYGARGRELANSGLKVKFQDKDTYVYRKPVDPTEINDVIGGNEMIVEVVYEVNVANLSTTLPVTIHNIENYFDSRYTLTTDGWKPSSGDGFSKASYSGDLNITLNPGEQSEAIKLTYTVSLEAIKDLLNEDATLNNAVEIQSYSTEYGEKTLYAEQRIGERTGTSYAGYDDNSQPGNAEIFINSEGILEASIIEDDTDMAPSFVLCIDREYNRILSGNVWEDLDRDTSDSYRLGDGIKNNGEKNVANVKVELFKVNDDGSLGERAKLYGINQSTGQIEEKDAVTYTNNEGYYTFGDETFSLEAERYIIKFTYGTGIVKDDGTTISSRINKTNISARDYKSTIINEESNAYGVMKGTTNNQEWYLNMREGYSIAVDNMEERVKISDLKYANYSDSINISAWSKPFIIRLDSIKINGFDFGIIERAKEDIFVETTIDYLKITLANGQVLTEGNPSADEMNYAKPVGFNQSIQTGSDARKALDKQIVVEMDTELMQGAKLETRYQITVTNKSEIDYDYYIGDYNEVDGFDSSKVRTEYYYFGEKTGSIIENSANKVAVYLDSELAYVETDLAANWSQVSAQELKDQGLISGATFNVLKNNGYIMYVTDKARGLKTGELITLTVNASKVLANQDENVYDIQAEILEVDAKTGRTTGRTTSTKQYKMGNYVPSLERRKVNNNIDKEIAGLHEQDDDRVKIIITPPTGLGTYIIRYLSIGLVGLIVIAIAVIFIKKKVLKK